MYSYPTGESLDGLITHSTRQDTRFIYEYSTSCTRPIRKKSILKMYRYTKRTKK